MRSWQDFPRTKDKVAICGMNSRTKDDAPFGNPDYEIFTLNEHGVSIPRFDRLFQIHKWEKFAVNNLAHPNHLLYLQNQSGPCLFCRGVGRVEVDGKQMVCPWCKEGVYTPLDNRKLEQVIYMQEEHEDIPGSVALPLDELTKMLPDGVPYFTSTFSMMLAMALLLGFPQIELYGFEMESDTEYAHQRVNAEYWVGFGRGRGVQITAPGARILKGELYGYEDQTQGFRTLLDLRRYALMKQLQEAVNTANISVGQVRALEPFKDSALVKETYDAAFQINFKNKAMEGFLRGTLAELENLAKMHDEYHGHAAKEKIETQRIALRYQNG